MSSTAASSKPTYTQESSGSCTPCSSSVALDSTNSGRSHSPGSPVPTNVTTVGSYLLDDRWAFWFYSKFSSWGPQLKPLYVVSTNVEFENKLEGMVKPSSVKAKAQLFVMKKGISPDRLDQRNAEGGCWALFIPVDYPNGKELLDTLWYRLCRAVVNQKFPHDDMICGSAVVMRNTQQYYPVRVDKNGEKRFDPSLVNRDRIELWTWEASECLAQVEIGQVMKALLDVPDLPLTYRNHCEVMTKRGQETIMYTLD